MKYNYLTKTQNILNNTGEGTQGRFSWSFMVSADHKNRPHVHTLLQINETA
jgi:hypothetical protein